MQMRFQGSVDLELAYRTCEKGHKETGQGTKCKMETVHTFVKSHILHHRSPVAGAGRRALRASVAFRLIDSLTWHSCRGGT
jgi:hypothetical protein